ncbi:MAG: hypothetical protein KDF25_09130 [Burkholderiaceae bacterium]|jgi:hypothetical protein|nr:hypothetical protein [Burkholderiaceae bacterium]
MLVRLVALLLTALTLAGCAVQRTVDSQVQSWSTLARLPQPPSYRLDLLPSQQQERSFDAIVPMAHTALARAGLQRDDAAPRLIAEIGVRTGVAYADGPWYPLGPWGGWGPWGGRRGLQGGLGWGFGPGVHAGWMLREMPPVLYRNEVSVVLRDAATQKTVYETSASNEDVWTDAPRIFGVLLDAALAGFPTPPVGPRQIRLPLLPGGAASR